VGRDLLPDARTVHAGLPVVRGEKNALNIWVCEGK
jgi:hypothetical protein